MTENNKGNGDSLYERINAWGTAILWNSPEERPHKGDFLVGTIWGRTETIKSSSTRTTKFINYLIRGERVRLYGSDQEVGENFKVTVFPGSDIEALKPMARFPWPSIAALPIQRQVVSGW